ncbi:MAG TPA: hypothetical protein VFW21_11780 [Mycobacterium sp.]|nr:hypothetical protein [Mycobacterium sp.]
MTCSRLLRRSAAVAAVPPALSFRLPVAVAAAVAWCRRPVAVAVVCPRAAVAWCRRPVAVVLVVAAVCPRAEPAGPR